MKRRLLQRLLASVITLLACFRAIAQPSAEGLLYHASIHIVVRAPSGADPVAFVRTHLPNLPAMTIKPISTSPLLTIELELGITDSDPLVAAKRANDLGKALPAKLEDPATGLPVFGISKLADVPNEAAKDGTKSEPAIVPNWPECRAGCSTSLMQSSLHAASCSHSLRCS